jgi:hypothetical protein
VHTVVPEEPAKPTASTKGPRVSTVVSTPPTRHDAAPVAPAPPAHEAPAKSRYVATGARAGSHSGVSEPKKSRPVVSGAQPAPAGDHGAAEESAAPHAAPVPDPPVAAAAPRSDPAVRPTRLADVHSRIAAALAELKLAAQQTGGDSADHASPEATAPRPAPRIRLDWPTPHLELDWPGDVRSRPRD